MKQLYTFLLTWMFLSNTLTAMAQSSILLEPNDSNGIFSKRATLLDPDNLPAGPVVLHATGAGTRLMWIPSKSAFRAGTVLGDGAARWDADSIGIFSFAAGLNSLAAGKASTALGVSKAIGLLSTALGNSNAQAEYSTAVGKSNALGMYSLSTGAATASGLASNALGNSNAKGDFSLSAGYKNYSSGESSVALGEGLTAYKYGGVSLGAYNSPGDTSITYYNTFTPADRIFQIGNGYIDGFSEDIVQSNALTILRNGNLGVGNTVATLAPAERVVIDGNVNVMNAAKGVSLSGSFSPLLTHTTDAFTSGTYQNLGRWGIFKDTDYLTLGVPALTNKAFRFVSYNANSTIAKTVLDINQNGNVAVDGYTKLGATAPSIKVLKLTGNTAAAQGTYATATHGLTLAKILSVEVFVSPSATVKHTRGWTAYAGHQFDFYVDNTVVQILNITGNSGSILSKPYTVLITYEL